MNHKKELPWSLWVALSMRLHLQSETEKLPKQTADSQTQGPKPETSMKDSGC